jgi:peroxiredoxin
LRGLEGTLEKSGGELVAIGSGTPQQAADFRREHSFPGRVLTDPELATYRAAGLRREARRVVTPGSIRRAIGAYRQGHRQGRVQGDPWQQGGTLVLTADGRPLLHHVSSGTSDHAAVEAIAAALRSM